MEMDWDRSVSGEIREASWSAVREGWLAGHILSSGFQGSNSVKEDAKYDGTRKWKWNRIRTRTRNIPALGHDPLAAPSHFNATGSKGSSVSET